jgi:hypothetical protein
MKTTSELMNLPAIEAGTRRALLTGKHAAFWYALHQAGVHAPVSGYGPSFGELNSEKNPNRK